MKLNIADHVHVIKTSNGFTNQVLARETDLNVNAEIISI